MLCGHLRRLHIRVEGSHQDIDGLVRHSQIHPVVGRGVLHEELEREVVAVVGALTLDPSVLPGEAAVDGADVDELVEHPFRHRAMVVFPLLGSLDRSEVTDLFDDFAVLRPFVEVHGHRDLINGVQREFHHVVGVGIHAAQTHLVVFQSLERRGAGERFHSADEPVIRHVHV